MQSLSSDRFAAAVLLAAVAGSVDAVGFSELGGHFVTFMSGNSTRLGLHFAAHEWPTALYTLGLVALFVGGAAAGALIAERAGRGASAAILLVEAVLLVAAAVLLDRERPLLGAVLLPPAMGLANALLLADGGLPGRLGSVTGLLARIGIALATLGKGGSGRAALVDLVLWLALVAGVALGAVGRIRFGGSVLLAPAAVLAAMGMAETLFLRRRVA